VEVYAKELRRKRADEVWERVREFPPMNLKWANSGHIYFPVISPGMGKHCDVAHVTDPAGRTAMREDRPGLQGGATALAFDVDRVPNHRGHIVGPGQYQLDILVAAENARPIARTVEFSLSGTWYADEERMLRDGVGVRVTGGRT
jgi:hypothetical protein